MAMMILLFDSDCILCNKMVQFVIKNDSKSKFKFAALQSESGNKLLNKFNLSTYDYNTFVYIVNDKYFTKSAAGLMVLKDLGGYWKTFYVLKLLPLKLRDFFYTQISKRRYVWYGRQKTCLLPLPEFSDRFLT